MIKAFALWAIVCGGLLIYGFVAADRIRVSARTDKTTKAFDVMVTANGITDARWVKVFLCVAEIRDDAGVQCIDEGWYATSTKPYHTGQPQYPFPFGRYIPRGTLKIDAIVADVNWKTLASGHTVVMR